MRYRRSLGGLVGATFGLLAVSCSPFGVEADPPDAATPPPPPPPRADGGDAGGETDCAPFCGGKTTTLFAQNFESSPSAPFTFDKIDDVNAATSTVVEAPGRLGTKALKVDLRSEARTRFYALLKGLGDAPPAPSRITLEVDVRVERTNLEYGALAAVGTTQTGFAGFIGVAAYGGDNMLGGIAPASPVKATPVMAQRGQWHRVEAVLDVLPTGRRYLVRIDGAVAEDRFLGAALPAGTRLDVRLGCFFTSDNLASAEIFFDNLIVRATSQ